MMLPLHDWHETSSVETATPATSWLRVTPAGGKGRYTTFRYTEDATESPGTSSYTVHDFMEARSFTPEEQRLAHEAARLCIRVRAFRKSQFGNGRKEQYKGKAADDILRDTDLSQRRQVQIMGAAIRIAAEQGENFSEYQGRTGSPCGVATVSGAPCTRITEDDTCWQHAD